MINNINTLQTNLTESSKLTTYTDEYLKESLANLGQRFSVKGDGVSLSEFAISDLFKDSDINESIDNACAYCINIKYTGDELNSYNINLSCNNNIVNLESYEYTNVYITEENILTPGSPKNLISYYNKNGYIQKLDNEYRTAFTGSDAGGYIIETTINNFAIQNDDSSNKLLNGLRFFVSTSDQKIKAISCSLQKNYYTESKNSSYYSFTVYDTVFDNLDILDELVYDNENLDLDVNNIVDKFVKENFLKIHTSEVDKDNIEEWKFFKECVDEGNGQLTFKLIENSKFNTLQTLDPKLGADIDKISIMFTYDVADFLPLAEKVYNNGMFGEGESENLKLKKRLVAQIAKKIFEDYKKDSNEFVKDITNQTLNVLSETLSEFNIYLPLNYKFVYSCNSNNQWQIYNSIDDIYVEYTAEIDEEINKILVNNPEQLMICDVPDLLSIDNKFNVYSFGITYTVESFVDDINVFKKFTLPYIDQNGYWSINDISTSVYARGKDGGQPSIIISYSTSYNDRISTEILSSFKKDELSSLDYELAYVKIRPIDDYNNINASSYHVLKTYMPVNIESLDDNFITFLEHTLILNIISTSCEDTKLSSGVRTPLKYNLGDNSVIPTFWALTKYYDNGDDNEDNGDNEDNKNKKYKYKFDYVKQPNMDWAIDMNYLSNADSLIKYYMTNFGINPDEYEHSWLVFDKISTEFKNNTNIEDKYDGSVWPVIINRESEYYAYIIGDAESRYENKLNLNIGFFNDIKKKQGTSYITGVDQIQYKDDDGNTYNSHYFSINKSDGGGKHKISRVTHYKQYQNEYIPDAKFGSINNEGTYEKAPDVMIPTLDLAEVFVRNQTTINRQNILAVDEDEYIYNAYIGTSFDSYDKSILHIGTSYTNPNIGEMTLMTYEDKSHFNTMNQLDIDFNSIHLNGNVITNGSVWTPFYDESRSGKNAWHTITKVGAIVKEIKEVDFTDNQNIDISNQISDISNQISDISDDLFFKNEEVIEPQIVLPNNDTISRNARYVYYLNLNKFFTEIAKVEGAPSYSTYENSLFTGENVKHIYDIVNEFNSYYNVSSTQYCYYLKLQTDLEESPISYNSYLYVLTNPIEFSYTILDKDKMVVTVREIVTDKSIPHIYANELL